MKVHLDSVPLSPIPSTNVAFWFWRSLDPLSATFLRSESTFSPSEDTPTSLRNHEPLFYPIYENFFFGPSPSKVYVRAEKKICLRRGFSTCNLGLVLDLRQSRRNKPLASKRSHITTWSLCDRRPWPLRHPHLPLRHRPGEPHSMRVLVKSYCTRSVSLLLRGRLEDPWHVPNEDRWHGTRTGPHKPTHRTPLPSSSFRRPSPTPGGTGTLSGTRGVCGVRGAGRRSDRTLWGVGWGGGVGSRHGPSAELRRHRTPRSG